MFVGVGASSRGVFVLVAGSAVKQSKRLHELLTKHVVKRSAGNRCCGKPHFSSE